MNLYRLSSTFDNLKVSFTNEKNDILVSSFRSGKSLCIKVGEVTYECRIKQPPISVFAKLPIDGLAVGSDQSSYNLKIDCEGVVVFSPDDIQWTQVLYYQTQPPGSYVLDIAHGRDNQNHRVAIRQTGLADALKVWTRGALKYGEGNLDAQSTALLLALILFDLYEEPLTSQGD
jgi:hypothetical protein